MAAWTAVSPAGMAPSASANRRRAGDGMFEHLNRLWKRIERIVSMNLYSTYQRYPSALLTEIPSSPNPDTYPYRELPFDPEPVLPFDPNPDTYPYREIPSTPYRPEWTHPAPEKDTE